MDAGTGQVTRLAQVFGSLEEPQELFTAADALAVQRLADEIRAYVYVAPSPTAHSHLRC